MESSSNPADDTSRGLSAQELVKSNRWIHGAAILWQDTSQGSKVESTVDEISEDDPEVRESSISCSIKASEAHSMTDLIFAKYSVWLDLKKTVA